MTSFGVPRGVKVKPLTRIAIRDFANEVRHILRVDECRIDMVRLLEYRLTESGIVFDICEADLMPQEEARAYPDLDLIKIRADVYESLHQNDKRARFTIAHEIGHLALHTSLSLARSTSPGVHRHYEDSEWQADNFAAEFLMPADLVIQHCRNAVDISEVFDVSMDAALIRKKVLQSERLIQW